MGGESAQCELMSDAIIKKATRIHAWVREIHTPVVTGSTGRRYEGDEHELEPDEQSGAYGEAHICLFVVASGIPTLAQLGLAVARQNRC